MQGAGLHGQVAEPVSDGALEQTEAEQFIGAGEADVWIFVYTLNGFVL